MVQRNSNCTKFLSVALLTCFAAMSAAVHAEPEVRETHTDWTVVCDTPEHLGEEICLIVQQKNMKDSNQPVIRIEIGYAPQNGEPLMLATVATALGLTLGHGLEMQVDQHEALRFGFSSCIPAGCVVATNMTADQINLLKQGNEARFTFQDTQGRRITVPISLNGFTAGFGAVSG